MSSMAARVQQGAGFGAEELIDSEALAEIVDECGAELMAELRDSLAEEGGERFDDLRQAVSDGDAEAAKRALHAVRGAALNLGFRAFAIEVQRVEAAAAAGSAPSSLEAEALSALFSASFDAVDVLLANGLGAEGA
ncbi:MAG: Hpt domain-containing protein [Pseudomonadota bacterium]